MDTNVIDLDKIEPYTIIDEHQCITKHSYFINNNKHSIYLCNCIVCSNNTIIYFNTIKHETQECCNVVIDRCNFPDFMFSIITFFVGCFNIISVIFRCNINCCENILIQLGKIAMMVLLLVVPILFIIYGTQNSIYYNNINSNDWIITEGVLNISYIIILQLCNHCIIIMVNYENIIYIYCIKIFKIFILLCKIGWTFFGLVFVINKEHNLTSTLIITDVVLVNIIQFIGLVIIIYN